MSSTISIITCICGLLAIISPAQTQGWRGIVPLHSTRADVEQLIGLPMMPNGITYDLKNERVNIVYSDGGCAKGQPSEWNVPLGTVIGITIYPQTKLMLSDLRIDLNRFKKFINPRNPDSVYYNNEDEGISIGTRSNEEVVVVQYLPAAKDSHLRCSNSPAKQSSESEKEYFIRKFDEYSNIPFSDEKARLDNFAIYLQREPKLVGYIITYAARRAHADEAKAQAERAKNYLVNVRGIERERIVTIDGGHRENLEVELYILPRGVPAPTPYPTVAPSEVQIIKKSSAKATNHRSSQSRCK